MRMVVAAGQVGVICAGAADGRRGRRRQVVAVVGGGGVLGQVPGRHLRRKAARHGAGHLHFFDARLVARCVGRVADAKAFRLLARRDEAGAKVGLRALGVMFVRAVTAKANIEEGGVLEAHRLGI